MIRKGFWLAVGAAGGIMGYRRVTALTRQVSQTLGTRQRTPATVKRHWAVARAWLAKELESDQ